MQAPSALNSVSRQVKCSHGLSSSSFSLVCSTAARHPGRRASVKAQVAASWIAGQAVGVGVAAAAAWWLSRQPEEAQDQMETTSRRPCPSCGGTGFEECMCHKWSDGDVGCSSCSHTGYMRCRSCGGNGTAVPIKVSIRKNDTL
eukprot:gene2435-biopygen4003